MLFKTKSDKDYFHGVIKNPELGMGYKLRFIQVVTMSPALDNALYSLAHPSAPDADPDPSHEKVVKALRQIADARADIREVTIELANSYEQEHCK